MGVSLSGEQIGLTLARADQRARSWTDEAPPASFSPAWEPLIRRLQVSSSPKTYLAVLAVMLVARTLHSREHLTVWDIKTSTSHRGYSASSIGSRLSTFAKSHNIDLRARSSQPMNNQPFTFKSRILRDPDEMTVAAKHHSAWRHFIAAVETVESASQDEAFEALALLFRLARGRASAIIADVESLRAKSLTELEAVERDVCAFVEEHPDGGRTGQAFVAAVLDLVYGPTSVLLGQVNDPDASRSGDVHVQDGQAVWLWTEVKQRVVSNGDVLDFSAQVAAEGGGRALYCALANERYPENLSPTRIRESSEAIGVALDFFVSPQALLQYFLRVAPGSPTQRIERLLQRLTHRMTEAEGSSATLANFGALVRRHANPTALEP